MRRYAVAAIVAAALTLTGNGASAANDASLAKRTFEKTVPVGAAPAVVVKSFAGDIHVTTSDERSVAVHARLRGRDQKAVDQIHVDVTQSGGTVHISARSGDANESILSRNGRGDRTADFDITVPRDASVDIDQFAGDITVDAPGRSVKVAERAGDVIISNVTGPVSASLLAGDMTVSLAPQWNGAATDARVRVGDLILRAPEALRARAKSVAHASVTIGDLTGF